MNKKKRIVFAAAAGVVLLLALLAVPCILIAHNTRTAKAAAREFTQLLTEGRLEELRLGFYELAVPTEESYVYDEEGAALLRFVDEAQLAERFGTKLVLAERGASFEEQLLSLFMEYATVSCGTDLALGSRATMRLTLRMPDLSGRMQTLTQQEAAGLLSGPAAQLSVFNAILEEGSFPVKEQSIEIPMRRQNKKWRFAVSPEMEKLWFCGVMP